MLIGIFLPLLRSMETHTKLSKWVSLCSSWNCNVAYSLSGWFQNRTDSDIRFLKIWTNSMTLKTVDVWYFKNTERLTKTGFIRTRWLVLGKWFPSLLLLGHSTEGLEYRMPTKAGLLNQGPYSPPPLDDPVPQTHSCTLTEEGGDTRRALVDRNSAFQVNSGRFPALNFNEVRQVLAQSLWPQAHANLIKTSQFLLVSRVRALIPWQWLALPSILTTSPLLLPHQHWSSLTPGPYLLQPLRSPSAAQTSPRRMRSGTHRHHLQVGRGLPVAQGLEMREGPAWLCASPLVHLLIYSMHRFARGLLSTTLCHCARCWGYSGEWDKQEPCPQGAYSVVGEMNMIK